MVLRKLSINYVTLACLILTSNAFVEGQPSSVNKVTGGGVVVQSIQMSDGNYAYLNYANGPTITKVNDQSGDTISETSFSFDDLPCITGGCGVALEEMALTSNGFVLVGWYREGGYYSTTAGIILNVDLEGHVVWSKLMKTNIDSFHSVIPAADGAFIVAGITFGYPVLIKFSSAGDMLWSKSFQLSSPFFRLIPSLDGGFIFAAGKEGFEGVNVIKMNDSGSVVWAATLEIEKFFLQSLTSLWDQGLLLAGKPYDSSKLIVIRLNEDGTLHSSAAYMLDVYDFFVTSLTQTIDGSIALGGQIYKKTGSLDTGLFLKINDGYQLTVKKRLGFPDSYTSINSVFDKQNRNFLLFGWTNSDTLFVRLNTIETGPGCAFFQNFRASSVPTQNILHKNLRIVPITVRIPPGESIQVQSKYSSRRVSNVCPN